MKSSGIGGQAVLEGVMMKNKSLYAVAVRKPDGEIAVEKGECVSITERHKCLAVPIVRGVVNFVESLVLGMKMLTSSAAYFDDEEEQPGKFELWLRNRFGEKADKLIMGGTVFASIILAVAVFMLLPLAVVSFIDEDVLSYEWKTLIEGLLRVAIFLGYVVLISRLKDIRRVFMYHGAEHKTINCIEHGMAPTVQNVRECSRLHKRCGTSFLLFVMLISVLFFLFVRVETLWLRFVVRILFVPVIAGVSYEFIRLAGSSDSKLVAVLSKPGLWLQGLTTREPDDDMIRVAVASVEAVFDWQAYLDENFAKKSRKKNGKVKKASKEKNVHAEKTQEVVTGELAAAELKKQEEVREAEEEVASKFDWSFPSVKKQEPDEAAAQENRVRLAAKVSAADKAEEAGKAGSGKKVASGYEIDEDEEEEDEILKALNKYFVYEGEGTVMERSGDDEH
ncbi:MAG: DUF1385 domain-containing protein [Lachnospiraceae bacterium]|nr:DUF1385 domain-containing protein [Lachnospiraceae bacterium]